MQQEPIKLIENFKTHVKSGENFIVHQMQHFRILLKEESFIPTR